MEDEQKSQLQQNYLHLHNSTEDLVGGVTLSQPAGGKDPPKKDPTTIKNKDIQRANIKNRPRPVSSGDQGDCTTESHRSPTIEVYTINSRSQNRSI